MKTTRSTAAKSYSMADAFAAGRRGPLSVDSRLRIDVRRTLSAPGASLHEVRHGLLATQKMLPPKYFYDDHGAQLFDAICDLPEYYLTRTEQALLQDVIDAIVELTCPSDVVEFGSGSSRKTRIVLDALTGDGRPVRYLPVDVSERMLRRSAEALLHAYPELRVHAIVGDYEHDLDHLPRAARQLVLFLGSTIGNFTPTATAAFLRNVRGQLAAGAHFLLGVDLVKPVEIIEAAYNDTRGLTAAFNRNILRVINRHFGADFDLDRFDHVAFFNPEQSQIEMHLRAREAHQVTLRGLQQRVAFAAGETILTEISRKFTRGEVEAMLAAAGFELVRWYTPANNAFGLGLARAG